MNDERFLKACVNGARVAMTPAQIAAEAAASIAAGAHAIHAHVYDAQGVESLAAHDVAAVVRACAMPIGISTGAWILPDPLQRVRTIASWDVLPAFASVNFIEDGAIDVARILFETGVGIEAGLSDAEAARRCVASGIPCVRILFEPQEQQLHDALRNVDAMETIVAGNEAQRVLHGFDATAWPLLAEARHRGYGARIGLEDTIHLPDGTPTSSNAMLVAAALSRLRERD
jgi:uncharacterized protein (DUF849 family)